jgi:DNA-binding NarL/FixJ family response regulator
MMDNLFLVLPGIEPSLWCHSLAAPETVLGRSNQCDVRLIDDTISRRHAKISRGAAGYHIEDLGSSNGTFVDENRVVRSRIEVSRSIRLGNVYVGLITRQAYKTNTAIYELKPTKLVRIDAASQLASAVEQLSEAQSRVLRLLLAGHAEKKIAEELKLSPHTVHTHVKNIYRALGVRSRAELMAAVFAKKQTGR